MAKSKIAAVGHEIAERSRAKKFGKGPQLGQQQTLGMKGGATLPVARGTQGSNLGKRAARDAAALDKTARGAQRIAGAMNAAGGMMIAAGGVMAGSGVGVPAGAAVAVGGATLALAGSRHALQAEGSADKARNVRLRGKGIDYQIAATKAGQPIQGPTAAQYTAADDDFKARRDAARGQAREAAGDTFQRTRRDPRSGKQITETVRNTRKAKGATAAAVSELAKRK